jgi:hypothetical protein
MDANGIGHGRINTQWPRKANGRAVRSRASTPLLYVREHCEQEDQHNDGGNRNLDQPRSAGPDRIDGSEIRHVHAPTNLLSSDWFPPDPTVLT